MKKVYLAGPDVFKDPVFAKAWFDTLKGVLLERGYEGLSPFDSDLKFVREDISPQEKAQQIFFANRMLIDHCDAVLANVSPFRGPSCDPGTSWEIGYADAKGVPVFAYSYGMDPIPDHTYKNRCDAMEAVGIRIRTAEYPVVEDFGLPDNLMIACSVKSISENALQAVIALSKYFKDLE